MRVAMRVASEETSELAGASSSLVDLPTTTDKNMCKPSAAGDQGTAARSDAQSRRCSFGARAGRCGRLLTSCRQTYLRHGAGESAARIDLLRFCTRARDVGRQLRARVLHLTSPSEPW